MATNQPLEPPDRVIDAENQNELRAYLINAGHLPADASPEITNLAGGVSNKTVLVTHSHGAWVVKQALARLRVEAEWFSDPARIHREAAGMRALANILPPEHLTRLVFEDKAHQMLAMDAVPIPHENFKQRLLRGHLVDTEIATFGKLLGTLHANTFDDARLAHEFADRSFFESLRLEPYYGTVAAKLPETAAFMRDLMEATRTTLTALVHGDYSPKNVLIRERNLILLDHEVIHYGDPAFDVGFALAHLLGKANHLSGHRGAFEGAALLFWESYLKTFPSADPQRVVSHAIACLLARAAGKSPLEYLTTAERDAQVLNCLTLIQAKPHTPDEFIRRFCSRLGV